MSTVVEPRPRRSREIAVPVFVGVALGLSGLYWLLFALQYAGHHQWIRRERVAASTYGEQAG